MKPWSLLTAGIAVLGASGPLHAEAPRRFAAEIATLTASDSGSPMAAGGALFLGSSSIRLWDVSAGLPSYPAINHGFGGATVEDVLANYAPLTAHLQPEAIILYVGENDIAAGRASAAVAGDLIALIGRLRHDFPTARIAYLSMKASPAAGRCAMPCATSTHRSATRP